jgi:signal transduction histidine kinase
MRLDLKLSQKVLILVTIPILFMLVFVSTLAILQKQAEDAVWRERHYKDISNECNSLITNFLTAGSNFAIYKSTNRDQSLDTFNRLTDAIPEQIRTLKVLLRESKRSVESISQLEAASDRAVAALQRARSLSGYTFRDEMFSSRQELTSSATDFIRILRDLVKEQQEQGPGDSETEERARFLISQCLIGGVLFSIVIAIGSAFVFNLSTTRRFNVLVDNTVRLGANKELLARLDGHDEIATVDRVFHQMSESLTEAAQRKQELLSIVSHDLRAPLTSVQAALTLLSERVFGDLSEGAEQTLAIAEGNVDRLIRLINDLLDFEKMEGGNLKLQKAPVAVEELFDRVGDVVSLLAEQKQLKVEFVSTDLVVTADGDRLIQVLINLISNAIKFSQASSTINVSAQKYDGGIEFKVEDQGRGIPKRHLKSIFERYEQVRKEDAQNARGTGLGLAICKAFVEAHGGTIGVTSEEGKGSTFWFRIPSEPAGA